MIINIICNFDVKIIRNIKSRITNVMCNLSKNVIFMETCTVLNNTLAWTPDKSYSEETCLDLDPVNLYENCPVVEEPIDFFNN